MIYLSKRTKNAWFQHDIAYGDFKDLPRKTACHKLLCNKAFNIAENPK